MTSFKQFLTEVMDSEFLVKLIKKKQATSPLYLQGYYSGGHYEEGKIESPEYDGVSVNSGGGIDIEFRVWSEDEHTFVPAVLSIHKDDVEKLYFGTVLSPTGKKRNALLMKD